MGITEQGLDFLVSARNGGVSFERTMTIGRQSLLVAPNRVAAMLSDVAAGSDAARVLPVAAGDGYADGVFRYLGAREVCSIDASGFEGATHSHDLNAPVPAALLARFSTVVDGGALEHIFDVRTAIANIMRMVAVGGHLLFISPVNNAPGHGFYQFSPELFFRVLGPDNGFLLERMLMADVRPGATWYRVVDPAAAGRRIEFSTRRQTYLYVQARKLTEQAVLTRCPVQSDYQRQWSDGGRSGSPLGAPGPDGDASRSPLGRRRGSMRDMVRRHPALHRPLRAGRRLAGRWQRYRHPLDPLAFEPLGRRLS